MKRKKFCAVVDIEIAKELEKVREETGISIGKQVELALKGYKTSKKEIRKYV